MVKQWIKTILSLALILVLGACREKAGDTKVSLIDFTGMSKDAVEAWRTENNFV